MAWREQQVIARRARILGVIDGGRRARNDRHTYRHTEWSQAAPVHQASRSMESFPWDIQGVKTRVTQSRGAFRKCA